MPGQVALVDLGSNAVRLLLAELGPGRHIRILREARAQTRLGGGRSGRLPRQAIADTLHAVRRFLRVVRNGQPLRVLAIATSAVRDAGNRDRLLEPLRRRHGVEVAVLSGCEEARLGALAALESLRFRAGVVMDLGGGSLQLTHVRDGLPHAAVSFPLGVVRTTRRFLRHDPPRRQELTRLRDEIRQQLAAASPPVEPGSTLVGLGGTVRALAAIHLSGRHRRERHGLRLSRHDITRIRARLEALPLRKRRRVPGLKAERADIIVAGALIVEELMLSGDYPALTVCMRGVRDGLLLVAAGRAPVS
jgi:exopolyphosphatase/guanosine-5'-triphosphate,3'-diphosphate pyrophosphatase